MRRSASEFIRDLEMRVSRLERTASNPRVSTIFIAPGKMAVYVDTDEAPLDFTESDTRRDVSYKVYPCKANLQSLTPVILATGGMFGLNDLSAKEKIDLMGSLGCKIPSEVSIGRNFKLSLLAVLNHKLL